MDCSPQGSSVHGISQARILEWVAISFSRGSSQPRAEPMSPVSAGGFFTTEAPGKPINNETHSSKVMLKILQARLQQYMNHELPDVQAGFRKGRGTRGQIANIHWIAEKARESHRNIYFRFTDYTNAFDCVDHKKLWKILKEVGISDYLTCLLRLLYAGQEQPLELNIEQRTGSKLGKKTDRAVYCNPACLTYMQSTSCEMSSWMNHKLEPRLPGEISTTSDIQMAPPLWQQAKRN